MESMAFSKKSIKHRLCRDISCFTNWTPPNTASSPRGSDNGDNHEHGDTVASYLAISEDYM